MFITHFFKMFPVLFFISHLPNVTPFERKGHCAVVLVTRSSLCETELHFKRSIAYNVLVSR